MPSTRKEKDDRSPRFRFSLTRNCIQRRDRSWSVPCWPDQFHQSVFETTTEHVKETTNLFLAGIDVCQCVLFCVATSVSYHLTMHFGRVAPFFFVALIFIRPSSSPSVSLPGCLSLVRCTLMLSLSSPFSFQVCLFIS